MQDRREAPPNWELVWMGAISLMITLGLPIAASLSVPVEYGMALSQKDMTLCLVLLAIVGAICWRVRTGKLPAWAVFAYGALVVLCAAELQVVIESIREDRLEVFLKASPVNPRFIVINLALALTSSMVQFGIAALGGGICTAALFLPNQRERIEANADVSNTVVPTRPSDRS